MTTSSLYPTQTSICKMPPLNRFNHKEKFSNASQRRKPIGRWVKTKADIEVINYTLGGVSIHPGTTKTQASFLTQLPGRKETAQGFHHEANDDFKTVQSLMAVIGEN